MSTHFNKNWTKCIGTFCTKVRYRKINKKNQKFNNIQKFQIRAVDQLSLCLRMFKKLWRYFALFIETNEVIHPELQCLLCDAVVIVTVLVMLALIDVTSKFNWETKNENFSHSISKFVHTLNLEKLSHLSHFSKIYVLALREVKKVAKIWYVSPDELSYNLQIKVDGH